VAALALSSIAYYVSFIGVSTRAAQGEAGGLYFDALVVTLVSQLVGCFSNKGWLIMLAIPAYAVAVGGKWVLGLLSSSSSEGAMSEEERKLEEKRKAKKEKKQKQGPRIKYR
jgi:hypothetical protein